MYTKCTNQWTDWLLASPGQPWVWYVALDGGNPCAPSAPTDEPTGFRGILEFGSEFMKLWASRRFHPKFGRPSVHQLHQPMNRLVLGRPGVWFVALDGGNPMVVELRNSVENSWSYERADIFMQKSVDRVCTKCTNRWTDRFSADPECDL